MRAGIWGSILILVSAVCFGVTGVVAKIAYNEGANAVFLLSMRFAIAAAVMWIYGLVKVGREGLGVTKEQGYMLFILGGVVNFATTMFYFNAINYIPVSLHIMVFSLYPLFVNLISVYVLKERITWKQCVALSIAISGSVMVVWAPGIYLDWIGVMLSLFGAVSNSIYLLIMGSRRTEGIDPITATTYISTFGAASYMCTGVLTGSLRMVVSLRGWGAILIIAIFSTVVATIALYRGIKMIGASKAAIISTFEPVITVALGILVLGEVLTFFQLTGVMLVISAVVLINTGKPGQISLPAED